MAAYKSPKGSVEKLVSYLKKNGKDKSWSALSKMFNPNGNSDWARSMSRLKGFDTTTNVFTVQTAVENTKYRNDSNETRKKNNVLVNKIIELEKDIQFLTDFKKHKSEKLSIQKPVNNKKLHHATAITQWSDWHVDEVVLPSTVNGLNEYNDRIAGERCKKLFENTVKLVDTQRFSVTIDNLVIHLGGDVATGWIHPEGMQTNSMTPQQGIFYAYDLHVMGVEYLLKYGQFKNIWLICSRGNHGRVTPKMQYGNDYATNNENYMYMMLANRFKNEPRVKFQLDNSELSYMQIYDKTLRFFHGWQIKFNGGIGGLSIPLYKQLHRWNANTATYYNFMCDKHSYSRPTPDCVLNGSLIGFNAYALSHGFSFEPPRQSFTLLDSKRGVTIKAPIFCD